MSKETIREPITDEWLREVGFKWSQIERQPSRHWILWLGSCINMDADGKRDSLADTQDLGIEIASMAYTGRTGIRFNDGRWFCWIRADTSGLYHRFLHVRHLSYRDEVALLVEALTGQTWNPENHRRGCVMHPKHAERDRLESERLDRKMLEQGRGWYAPERDDHARPMSEHLRGAIEADKAK